MSTPNPTPSSTPHPVLTFTCAVSLPNGTGSRQLSPISVAPQFCTLFLSTSSRFSHRNRRKVTRCIRNSPSQSLHCSSGAVGSSDAQYAGNGVGKCVDLSRYSTSDAGPPSLSTLLSCTVSEMSGLGGAFLTSVPLPPPLPPSPPLLL